MSFIIDSDFVDYYDEAIRGMPSGGEDIRLVRKASRNPPRDEGLRIGQRAGNYTLNHGRADEMSQRYRAGTLLAVHDSWRLHEGGPPKIMRVDQAVRANPDAFCTRYEEAPSTYCAFTDRHNGHRSAAQITYLIGDLVVQTERWSASSNLSDDGRSYWAIRHKNDTRSGQFYNLHSPLMAISRVASMEYGSVLNWIDFAPKLAGTPLERMVTPEEIADGLMRWWARQRAESEASRHVVDVDASTGTSGLISRLIGEAITPESMRAYLNTATGDRLSGPRLPPVQPVTLRWSTWSTSS